jgi:hypothetical protein
MILLGLDRLLLGRGKQRPYKILFPIFLKRKHRQGVFQAVLGFQKGGDLIRNVVTLNTDFIGKR